MPVLCELMLGFHFGVEMKDFLFFDFTHLKPILMQQQSKILLKFTIDNLSIMWFLICKLLFNYDDFGFNSETFVVMIWQNNSTLKINVIFTIGCLHLYFNRERSCSVPKRWQAKYPCSLNSFKKDWNVTSPCHNYYVTIVTYAKTHVYHKIIS